MANTRAFTARPVTRKSVDSWIREHASPNHPVWFVERSVEDANDRYLRVVLEHYQLENWKWNPGARFLFRCLCQALDLKDYEDFLLKAARPKPGRPRANPEQLEYIRYLQAQGKKHYRIRTMIKKEFGIDMSLDAIRDSLKPPRKHQKQKEK